MAARFTWGSGGTLEDRTMPPGRNSVRDNPAPRQIRPSTWNYAKHFNLIAMTRLFTNR